MPELSRESCIIMMEWLPESDDFANQLKVSLAESDPDVCCEALLKLSQLKLDYIQTIQLDRAWSKRHASQEQRLDVIRLAILSSCTADHLLPAIRVAGLRQRMQIEVYLAPYGQHQQSLLDPSSELHTFSPDFILLSLDINAAIPALTITLDSDAVEQQINQAISELEYLWNLAQEKTGATIIQQLFLDKTQDIFGSYDRMVAASPTEVVRSINHKTISAAKDSNVFLLDIIRPAARCGLEQWFDASRWLQAKIEIAPLAAGYYGELVARAIGAMTGRSRKCLVMDLDDTIWGGIVGDSGMENLVLGEGSATGEAHLALQRYALQLKERGVLLAICSKNDHDIAISAFKKHPEMLLKYTDITAFNANWENKPDNLRDIAEQLNIGLESLVFADDNPAERDLVRNSLPMVAVPELGSDPALYVDRISSAGYFEATAFTNEDKQRTDQYRENAERAAIQKQTTDLDDFLRNLDMVAKCGPVEPADMARATQLINKTNQFNATTIRYTPEELTNIIENPSNLVLQGRLTDRFGDNGLVTVMILETLNGE
ncbi:MAG: HAD-IIIC family phosphatase, partial [Gammaproteobacteria bacterium]|nr:HAD-IIIC family phosphatase [Gammaproteobacteria bacterium]